MMNAPRLVCNTRPTFTRPLLLDSNSDIMSQMANLALDGGDPRLHTDAGEGTYGSSSMTFTQAQQRKLHDPSVTFEEYAYYAQVTRAEEDRLPTGSKGSRGIMSVLFPSNNGASAQTRVLEGEHDDSKGSPERSHELSEKHSSEKGGNSRTAASHVNNSSKYATISDSEWINANRALRTASTSAVFYLITTDILGPFGLPYAFASLGWGPGCALFTVLAALAGYSGYLLWQMFMGMDSYQYPVKSYGDLGFRLYGRWLRYLFNFLQGVQLLLNVGLIVISTGEALSQAVKFKLCFAICCLVWAIAGFVVGQVRTLQKFGFLANAAVWINIIVMIVTMVAVAVSSPNYKAVGLSAGAGIGTGDSVAAVNGVFPPVTHYANIPPSSSGFAGTVNGAMQAVFSYGGAMVFPEFMSEMRRPRDFLKGMWGAQIFIYLIYMFYGLFLYGYQGQYVVNPSYLGVSGYTLQTIGNVFAMLSSLIAAALYGNIGVKVIYNNVFVEMFNAPTLLEKRGKIFWTGLIPIYWTIAFVVAAGIPDFSGLTGVVAAFCILHFTYTFPPLLSIAYLARKNALLADEGFDPSTGQVVLKDSGLKRIMRGFFAREWYLNLANIIYMLGALALSGLGAYGACINLINAFKGDTVNSFVCHSPLDG